ncbi:glycosyltransferase family 39 protein [Candidatus Peregrinibacteria bacterium]|nr:glycosyltransferase family 39 protein [Candidatus Peregrinibacteria bacterium]
MTFLSFIQTRRGAWYFFIAVFLVLVLLWLPGVKYPVLSDTAIYAFLGDSLWKDLRYELLDVSYSKHLPFHAFTSHPLVEIFGYTMGMKLATLFAGFGVLTLTYIVLRKTMPRGVAEGAVLLLLFQHAFVLMIQLGSADLLFTALFLLAVYGYVRADEDERWYAVAFIAAGCATLTRYNGAPLFILFLGHTFFRRRSDFTLPIYWASAIAGGLIFGLWLIRNAYVFGNPLHTDYTGEYADHTPNVLQQIVSNTLYYLHPLHNFLPLFLTTALYGLWKHAREQWFLIAAMLAAWVMTSFWWMQAMRFAFPGFPILAGFAVWGFLDLWKRIVAFTAPGFRHWLLPTLMTVIIAMHGGALCLYAYGECNAAFDRYVGVIPKDLGLTPEGFYAWHEARQYMRSNLPDRATVYATDTFSEIIWRKDHALRPDIRIVSDYVCGSYRFTQRPDAGETVLFTSIAEPKTSVAVATCE